MLPLLICLLFVHLPRSQAQNFACWAFIAVSDIFSAIDYKERESARMWEPERPERDGPCGVLSWLVRWAYHSGTKIFCPALAALVGPVQNMLFLSPHTISLHLSPIAQPVGQAVVLHRLSLNMCLWWEMSVLFSLSSTCLQIRLCRKSVKL